MQFKNEHDKELFFALHPALILIYADLYFYAYTKHNIELVVTSTVSAPHEDRTLKRTSNSHLTRRALDIRLRDIPPEIANDLVDYVNLKEEYQKFKYVSAKSGKRYLAFTHGVGNNKHIHLALHSKYSLEPLFKN